MKFGRIAIVGRPNVGKSSLLNALLGQKLSITSRRPQTTRSRIQGILTSPDLQLVFVDTPGYQTSATNSLVRSMNRSVITTLDDTDRVLLVIEALNWTPADQRILEQVSRVTRPILVINKIDRVKPRERLLPFIDSLAPHDRWQAVVPVSATTRDNLEGLLSALAAALPEGEAQHDSDSLSDQPTRFFVSEFIREPLFRLLGDELPYQTAVVIDQYEEGPALIRIEATILVDHPGQKAIVIGQGGQKLKEIGTAARQSIERFLEQRVYLGLWVKVRRGWLDDRVFLRQLGHDV